MKAFKIGFSLCQIDNINKNNNFPSELELSADQIGGENVPTLDTVVDMKVIQWYNSAQGNAVNCNNDQIIIIPSPALMVNGGSVMIE